jgi:hypothetical protein
LAARIAARVAAARAACAPAPTSRALWSRFGRATRSTGADSPLRGSRAGPCRSRRAPQPSARLRGPLRNRR